MWTLIAAAKNSLRNKQVRPPSNPSRWSAAAARQAGRGRGSEAVGAPFIKQTAGAEPRLAPLNTKPPDVFKPNLALDFWIVRLLKDEGQPRTEGQTDKRQKRKKKRGREKKKTNSLLPLLQCFLFLTATT